MYRYIRASKYNPNNVINPDTTGTSYYDNFLNESDLKYMEKAKNRTGRVVYMSPEQYYQACADYIFNTTVDSLISQRERDNDSLEYLDDVIQSGGQFDLPYINYADDGQEGLHRMMLLSNKFGWDAKFPVLLVDYVDKHKEEVGQATQVLKKAISEALEYRYRESDLAEDLIAQVQFELNKRSADEESEYTAIVIKEDDSDIVISLVGFEDDIQFEIDKEDDINISDASDFDIDEDDLELTDEDLEDIDILDFLYK